MAVSNHMFTTRDFAAPKELVKGIFDVAKSKSVVAQLATARPINLRGEIIPVFKPSEQLGVVGEGERKPVAKPVVEQRFITPIKVAQIMVFSEEQLATDDAGVFEHVKAEFAVKIQNALDSLVLHAENPRNHAVIAGQTGVVKDAAHRISMTDGNVVDAFYAALDLVEASTENGVNGIAADTRVRSTMLRAQTAGGLVPNYAAISDFGGFKTAYNKSVGRSADGTAKNTRLIVGDWSQVIYGLADTIDMTVLDQASVEMPDGSVINLAQDNAKALRFETKIGAAVLNENAFAVVEDTSAA